MTGFGFLAVSRYRGLAGLGWLAMTAIALAFAAAICLLPAFVAVAARDRRTR
jgi:predicted RND superfamily exporter protein